MTRAEIMSELIRKCGAENAAAPQNQVAYLERYRGLKVRCEAAKQRLKQIEDQCLERKNAGRKCWSLFGCWKIQMEL